MLVLIRHAKSSWHNAGLSDFERPLNERGQADVFFMARHIMEHVAPPDYFLTSAARRAVETASGLLREMGKPNDGTLMTKDELYLASSEDILSTIQHEGRGEVLYVCGHNPGISNFVSRISIDHIDQLPTLGTVIFHFHSSKTGDWNQLTWNSLTIKTVITPRHFRTSTG